MIYLENIKNIEALSSTQQVGASTGYDGFVSMVVTIDPVDIEDVSIYVGDYTNDVVTLTSGSKDKYYRRIYGE